MQPINKIIHTDVREFLPELSSNSTNLIFTSPPYANKRGAVKSDEYLDWFLPISKQLLRILKPDGSFILVIKEGAKNGERTTYVLELILAMKKQGWLWTEEYIWHKKNSYPGKWPNRFRDAWERCLHFTKNKKFKMNQQDVMTPVGEWSKKRLDKLSVIDKTRNMSKVGSGLDKNISNWVGRSLIYPTNVLHLSTECSNQGHSAAFPISLPTWFIKLFTDSNDIVFDPFMGSGTTAIACKQLDRNFIGCEIDKQYVSLARQRLKEQRKAVMK